MLRDIPRIYFIMFTFVGIMVLLIYWYLAMFQRGSDTMALNESILSAAVSEVDQSARLNDGSLILKNTFEPTVWSDIKGEYPDGTIVQFDYYFDTSAPGFTGVPQTAESPPYKIGDAAPSGGMLHMRSRPVEHVRVKVRVPGDKVGDWTHVATVTVDVAGS